MKEIIVELLQNKGGLKEKKIWKKVCKKLRINIDEEQPPQEIEEQFHSTIQQLLEEKDIVEVDGIFNINKAKKAIPQTNTKRKAALDDYKGTDEQEVKRPKHGVEKQYQYVDLWKNGEKYWREGSFDPEYLSTNPDGITRLFCGNLNKKITENDLHTCLPGITYIKWITDKETGEFYGSSFLEMKDPSAAAAAVLKDGSKFLGRPLKIYYCPPRPGDRWPPREASVKPTSTDKEGRKQNGGNTVSVKPEGCKKLFAGNLSYEIDDDTICDFFKDCGTVVGLRWLTHKDTGDFRVIHFSLIFLS